jgi:hypothetical protein
MPAFPAHDSARSGSTAGAVLDAGGLQKAWAAHMVGGSEQGVARRVRWGKDTVVQLQKCPEERSDKVQTLTGCVVQSVPTARHACFIFCLLAGSDGQEPAWRSTSAWCARARTSMLFSMFYSGFVHLCIGIHATKPHINIIMWSTPLTACFCVNLFDIAGV